MAPFRDQLGRCIQPAATALVVLAGLHGTACNVGTGGELAGGDGAGRDGALDARIDAAHVDRVDSAGDAGDESSPGLDAGSGDDSYGAVPGEADTARDSALIDARIPEGGPADANASDVVSPDATRLDAGDAGAPDTAAPDVGAPPPDTGTGDGGPHCDLTGFWATRNTIDVTWTPQGAVGVILAPGSGTIQQWTLTAITQTGMTATESIAVCAIGLPDFSGTTVAGAETYGAMFPDSLFDNGLVPTLTAAVALSGSTPGSTYTTTPFAALLGLTMANPLTDPWPSTVTTAVDADNDGNPGDTLLVKQGGKYSDLPVDLFKSARADKIYVAIRQITQITATIDDCDHRSGTTTIPRIATGSTYKYAIDSHIIGCELTGGGQCSSGQTSFLDATQPVFTPSGPSQFASVRLDSGATCATVRQRLP